VDLVLHVHPLDLPRVAVAEPVVRNLDLVAVLDDLLEDAVVVSDAVAPGWQVESGEGVQEAGCQSPQASVAQSGINLLLIDALQVVAQVSQSSLVLLLDVEVVESILQAPPDKEFQGEVIYLFATFLVEGAVGVIEALDEPISDRMGHGLVAVALLEVEPSPGEGILHMVHNAG